MSDQPRAVWNVVALVSTLALAAVVAVVAVTRSDEPTASPAASPSVSVSPSPSPSPGELAGAGPFIVLWSGDGKVVAYDLPTGRATTLGTIEPRPVIEAPRQPGGGRLVAFPTESGEVWKVSREGLTRVATIPPASAGSLAGRAVSPDGRRMASLTLEPDPGLVVVDLEDGGIDIRAGEFRGDSPDEPLLPVGWSLGGTILYELPFCRCPSWSEGLFAVDLEASSISVVPGTRSDRLDRFVLSQEGQTLLYGTEGPPYELRRVAAGQRGADVIRESRDASLEPVAVSPDGRLVLLERTESRTGRVRYELADTESGDAVRRDTISRIPAGARGLALLPDQDAIVVGVPVATGTAIVLVREDRTQTLGTADGSGDPLYLGWLR